MRQTDADGGGSGWFLLAALGLGAWFLWPQITTALGGGGNIPGPTRVTRVTKPYYRFVTGTQGILRTRDNYGFASAEEFAADGGSNDLVQVLAEAEPVGLHAGVNSQLPLRG